MLRKLDYVDILFLKLFDEKNSQCAKLINLVRLMKLLNPKLFALTVTFTFDEKVAEDILDDCWQIFIKMLPKFNPYRKSITYEIFLILKELISKHFYENLK